MEFRETSPGPAAAPLIESIWMLSCDAGAGAGEWAPIVPDGCVEIVLSSLGDVIESPRFCSAPPRTHRCGYVLGVTTGPCHIRQSGPLRLRGIRLRPAASIRLFGPDLAALRDSACSVRELLPDLGDLPATEDASTALERALVQLIGRCRDRSDDRVAVAMSRIISANGQINLSTLARDLAVSTRQLDRWFDRYLGMPPKRFCRIARFREAWRLGVTSSESWASIAAHCGYSDQAHLCREFRELAGQSPSQTHFG
jgi:AraC-like DNA-binding protein